MATKSKSTDVFKGLVSWVCFLLVLLSLVGVALYFLILILDPLTAQSVGEIIAEREYYGDYMYNLYVRGTCIAVLFAAAVLLIFLFRSDRRHLESRIAHFLSRVWVEIKLTALFLICLFSGIAGNLFLLAFALVLCVYFLCLDIGHNRRLFGHNIIHSVLLKVNECKNMPTFERRSMKRLYSTLVVILCVACVSFSILMVLTKGNFAFFPRYYNPVLWFLIFAIAAFAIVGIVGTIMWYTLALKRDLRDWNELLAQIAEMYGGNLNAVNHVSPTSNLYDCAMQLNMIRTGIEKAVEEGTKADRTKVELITNVSHDIKTPLTSIISYVELLKKEEGLPEHVMDYIQTISRKAERLSSIVQDVFEVSKAATGNITLNLETLDIGKLLRQTSVEMSETIQNSPITWRMDIPEAPVLVHADGQRLYRVFQNLIRNCAQYSLEGSRAYVTLSAENGVAQVSIRNISKNEIQFDGEELTARFVRGDQNRTSEGSGLGLSIAKSFTEACGGKFFVKADNDIFTVTVQFPIVPGEYCQPAPETVLSPAPAPVQPEIPAAVPAPQTETPPEQQPRTEE